MLSLKCLTKVYRTTEVETTALRGHEFEVSQGEFLANMGPSGCGKSTLLNIVGMLDSPSGGEYWFCGPEHRGLEPGRPPQIPPPVARSKSST